jgi:ArsR family transcriptional regulator
VGTVPDHLLEETARRFRLLGDATRLRLLNVLQTDGELAVSELADRSGTSVANASKHLANLEREGIVARRRNGTTVRYRICDATIASMCELVCAGLRERYAGLARLGVD